MRALLLGLLLCVGCGSLSEEYVKADRATYDALAPEYKAYVESGVQITPDGGILLNGDPASEEFYEPILLSDEQKEFRLRTLRLWEARLLEAEAALAREKAGDE